MTDIPQNIWTSVVTQLFVRLNIREKEFDKIRAEKYADCSNDITIDGIKRGDVLLSVTPNSMLMAASSEGDVIHATLCIADPTSDNDMAFLSIQRMNGVVEILPITDLRQNASQDSFCLTAARRSAGRSYLRCVRETIYCKEYGSK